MKPSLWVRLKHWLGVTRVTYAAHGRDGCCGHDHLYPYDAGYCAALHNFKALPYYSNRQVVRSDGAELTRSEVDDASIGGTHAWSDFSNPEAALAVQRAYFEGLRRRPVA